LVLLLVIAAYATVRALERGSTWWLVLAGSCVGFGFITKMLQALLVVPAIALVYLLAGPPKLGRRIGQLLLGGLAMVVSAGWWVAAVELTPAADRPYIGGSQNNNLFNLVFGYNGFGRITGNETGSVGGGPSGTSMWGPTGWSRMFNSTFGTQASWLIPAALVALVAVLWMTRRAPRQDRTRAAFILWGGWLVVTAAVFSFAQGIIHPYYTIALAPAIGALVGMGAVELWRHRHQWFARAALAVATLLSAWWAFALLGRTPGWLPWLRFVVLTAGIVVAAGILAAPVVGRSVRRGVAILGVGVALAGPLSFTLDAVGTPASGAIPVAGPTSPGAGTFGGPGGAGGPGGFAGRFSGRGGFTPGTGAAGRGFGPPAGAGARPSFGTQFAGPVPGGAGFGPGGRTAGGGAGGGGLLNASTPSAALVKKLQADAGHYTWVAAAVGANTAAGYQLGTRDPVMAIGGFNGTDPDPSLAAFKALVSAGKIHYFIAGGGGFGGFTGGLGGRFGAGSTGAGRSGGAAVGGGGAESEDAQAITTWVEGHYTAEVVGGVTLYDLSPSAG
jgi:4-amino-4-deoxy-L-arabinose transferase-like glycosyltransferase